VSVCILLIVLCLHESTRRRLFFFLFRNPVLQQAFEIAYDFRYDCKARRDIRERDLDVYISCNQATICLDRLLNARLYRMCFALSNGDL